MTDIELAIVHYDGNKDEPYADLIVEALKKYRATTAGSVKHNKWKYISDSKSVLYGHFICLGCGHVAAVGESMKYCSNCGCEMKT